MHRKPITIISAIAALLAPALIAQNWVTVPALTAAAADLPSVDSILADSTKAIGGRKAVDAVQTLRVTSTMSMMGQTMESEQSWSRDGGRLTIMKMAMGEMAMGSDGETAWIRSPMGYMLAGEEQATQINGQVGMFMFLLDPRSLSTSELQSIEVVGKEVFGGAECYKLHYTDADGGEGHMFFRTGNGLPAGFQTVSPHTRERTTMRLSDWRAVSGVQFPHLMTMEMAAGQAGTNTQSGKIRVSKIEVNTLKKDHFALPAEVRRMADEIAAGPKPGAEIKLSDLTPQQQEEAKQLLEGLKQAPASTQRTAITNLESGLQWMPEEQRKVMQYVVQEMKKELRKQGG